MPSLVQFLIHVGIKVIIDYKMSWATFLLFSLFRNSLDWDYLLLESLAELAYKSIQAYIYFFFLERNLSTISVYLIAVDLCRFSISCVNFRV